MPRVRITSKVDAVAWAEFRELAHGSGRTISSELTAAIREYLARRRVRPEVLRHLEDELAEHKGLGRLLAD